MQKFQLLILLILLCLANQITCPVFSAPCKTSSECHQIYNSNYICGTDDNKCRHQALWPPNTNYIIGFVLIVIISAFANAGGLGGGAVIVPIFMFLFNYITPESIPLSKATILAGAIMNVALILNRRHPKDKNALVIDYALAGTCIPLLLSGTMIGVLLTKVLPPIIVVVLLSAYLVLSSWKMYEKAVKEQKKESAIFEEEKKNRELEMADPDERASLNKPTGNASQNDIPEEEGIFNIPKIKKAKGCEDRVGVNGNQNKNKDNSEGGEARNRENISKKPTSSLSPNSQMIIQSQEQSKIILEDQPYYYKLITFIYHF